MRTWHFVLALLILRPRSKLPTQFPLLCKRHVAFFSSKYSVARYCRSVARAYRPGIVVAPVSGVDFLVVLVSENLIAILHAL